MTSNNHTKFFFLILILISNLHSIKSDKQIKYVYQLNRHGAREPFVPNNNFVDIFNTVWSNEIKLLEPGKRSSYINGMRTRLKYKDYLSKTYLPNEVFFLSISTNRTFTSSYSYQSGLFDSIQNEKIPDSYLEDKQNYDLNFPSFYNKPSLSIKKRINDLSSSPISYNQIVIPVHSLQKKDIYMIQNKKDWFDYSIKGNLNEGLKLQRKYMETYGKYFRSKGFQEKETFESVKDLTSHVDMFLSNLYNGKDMSSLDFGVDYNEMISGSKQYHNELVRRVMLGEYDESKLRKTFSTLIIKDIIDKFSGKIENEQASNEKIKHFSCDDLSLSSIMTSIEKVFSIQPNEYSHSLEFSSILNFELYMDTNDNKHYIDIEINYEELHKKLTRVEFSLFKQEMTKDFLSLDEIYDFIDFDNESKEEKYHHSRMVLIYVMIGLGCFSLILIILMVLFVIRSHNKKKGQSIE